MAGHPPLGQRWRGLSLSLQRQLNHLYYGSGHLHQLNLNGRVICDFKRDQLHDEVLRTQGSLLTENQLAAWQAARQEAFQRRADAPIRHYLLDKHLRFTGPRQFHHSLVGGWQLSEPQPATSVPLRWKYAFGGSSVGAQS